MQGDPEINVLLTGIEQPYLAADRSAISLFDFPAVS